MRNKKRAFTLAEVLITLTLIGVLSALTIPTVVNNISNTTNVIQLKKVFGDFQQAFMLLQAENGGSIVPVFQNDTITNNGNGAALNAFLTKLNYVKNCGNTKGCWYDTPQYYLTSLRSSALDTAWNGTREKAILASGSMIIVSVTSASCTTTGDGLGITPLLNNTCASLGIDLNGDKGPNKVGRDYFTFWITQTGIYPEGTYNDGYSCNVSPGDAANSYGCAAKVLSEGAMNY